MARTTVIGLTMFARGPDVNGGTDVRKVRGDRRGRLPERPCGAPAARTGSCTTMDGVSERLSTFFGALLCSRHYLLQTRDLLFACFTGNLTGIHHAGIS